MSIYTRAPTRVHTSTINTIGAMLIASPTSVPNHVLAARMSERAKFDQCALAVLQMGLVMVRYRTPCDFMVLPDNCDQEKAD